MCITPFSLCCLLHVEAVDGGDGINVRFMKTGGHYLWPNIGDLSFVFVHEIVEILPAPHIDGRGKHFF